VVAVSDPLSGTAPDAPSAQGAKTFAEAIRDAQANIAASVELAGLRRDPLRYSFAALSTTVGLFPDFLARVDAAVDRAHAPWTDDERRAAVADAVARMDARLAYRMVQFNRWAVGLAVLLGMAMAGGAWGGGYWWGYRAAEDRLVNLPAAFGEALTGRDAGVWVNLVRNNDIGRVNRTCNKQNDREACAFWLWTEPAPLRTAGAH
jgi:hypothetical protein